MNLHIQITAPASSTPAIEGHSQHVANPVTDSHNPSHKQKSNNDAHPGIPIVGPLAPAAPCSTCQYPATPTQRDVSILPGGSSC